MYYEPTIDNCTAIPDFFVVNPRTGRGNILELCLRRENQGKGKCTKKELSTFKRKKRQKQALLNTGIPCIFLYREQQENIRRYTGFQLF